MRVCGHHPSAPALPRPARGGPASGEHYEPTQPTDITFWPVFAGTVLGAIGGAAGGWSLTHQLGLEPMLGFLPGLIGGGTVGCGLGLTRAGQVAIPALTVGAGCGALLSGAASLFGAGPLGASIAAGAGLVGGSGLGAWMKLNDWP